jgi:raffinose/stachyose/melibiose transport system permease protein
MTSSTEVIAVVPPGSNRRRRPRGSTIVDRRRTKRLHFILAPLAVLWLIPLIMVVGISLLPSSSPGTVAFGLFPKTPSFDNYALVWSQNPILLHLLNSLLISVPSVALVVLFGSMAAFAFARMRVPLKGVFFVALTLGLVLPMVGIIVGTFKILQGIGLFNNLLGIVLVYTALGIPFAVIIMRMSFLSITYETFEAARVDGANWFQIYWRIYMPMSAPGIAVAVIWQSMMSWNDFLLPLVTLVDNESKPLTLVPMAYRGTYLSQPGALFAVLVLISIPLVAVFLFTQRYLVNGLAGAVK